MTTPDSQGTFSPPQIQSRQFTVVRRGYDRAEVTEFLNQISTMMAELLKEQAAILATQADAADKPSSSSEAAAPEASDQVSEEQMAAVEDIEARAARRLNAASLEADRLRVEARRVLEAANAEVRELEATTRLKAEQLMAEAKQTRQKIMADLMRRRKEAQAHVEMLRAARDELLTSFAQVQRITAQAVEPLEGVLERAKSAADNAVRQFKEQQQDTFEEPELVVADVPEAAEQVKETGRVKEVQAANQEAAATPQAAEAPRSPETLEPSQPEPEAVQPEAKATVEPDEPAAEAEQQDKLSSIFARLHEGESSQPESSGSQPEPQPSGSQVSEAQPPEPSSTPQPSEAQPPEPQLEPQVSEAQPPEPESAPQPSEVQLSEPGSPEPQPGPQTASAPSRADQAEAELMRQLKRGHTEDESRVLQAIQKFHGKPRKLKDLTFAIMDSELRLATYQAALHQAISMETLNQVLLLPLAEALDSCELQLSDSKSLIQQVREIYRQFSQNAIPVAAAELASSQVKV